MGDDERLEAIADIQDRLLTTVMDDIACDEDLAYWTSKTLKFAEQIFKREEGLRAIIATVIDTHAWRYVIHKGEPWLFIPTEQMKNAPPSIVIEKATDEDGYYFRVGR